jgi:hypothetical protein
MAFTVTTSALSVLNMNRRMTFHFGNVSVSEGPQILLTLTADVHGQVETGQSMGALAPMWFYKDPDMTMDEGIDAMIEVFETACDLAEQTTEPTVFGFWRSLYDSMADWAADTSHPPLLWSYGVSLVEQAAIDAFCRAIDTSFPSAVHENELGIDLGAIYEDLSGREPTELLPEEPHRSTAVRHTVGLGDPLTVDDIAPEDRLDDGLPQALSEYIEIQGIDHFKVKLAATDADVDRLKRIHDVIENRTTDYAVTVDANEQYESAGDFRNQWVTMQNDPDLTAFLDHVLYVEQPLARNEAFTDETREVFEAWDDQPPVIIDESDDRVTSLKTALDCGYAGTSHKNCKGVFKGIANRCLIEHYRRNQDQNETRTYVMSGEDLTTLGPIELQQDLAVMATLGMDHVERNGHHYYRGLSMLPDDVQAAVLDAHGDLYRRHENGFATLDIQEGRIRLDSVLEAPFGRAIDLDSARFTRTSEWDVESIYESL